MILLGQNAKKTIFSFSIICLVVLFLIMNVKAATTSRFYANGTGTEVDLSSSITKLELETGTHEMQLSIELLTINQEAYNIIEIKIDYKIGSYYADYIELNGTLDGVGNKIKDNETFQYEIEWGVTKIEMKLSLTENISESIKNPYSSLWLNFFTIKPLESEASFFFIVSFIPLLLLGLNYTKKRKIIKKIDFFEKIYD